LHWLGVKVICNSDLGSCHNVCDTGVRGIVGEERYGIEGQAVLRVDAEFKMDFVFDIELRLRQVFGGEVGAVGTIEINGNDVRIREKTHEIRVGLHCCLGDLGGYEEG
jgi:hypothetical protein